MDSDEDQQALAWQQIIKNRAFYNVRVQRGESWVDAACRTLDELIDQKEQAEESFDKKFAKLMSDYQDVEDERDEWQARAEAAEARTAPAVTKAEIEQAIRETEVMDHRRFAEFAARAVFDLVSGDDPAVFVVRESQIAAVEVGQNEDGRWCAEGDFWPDVADIDVGALRRHASASLADLVAYEAVARAIEAEQAADPLLDKALEFAALADWELTDREAELLHTVAAHVLGQEAGQ